MYIREFLVGYNPLLVYGSHLTGTLIEEECFYQMLICLRQYNEVYNYINIYYINIYYNNEI